MPNNLNLPVELQHLIEKRELEERRLAQRREAENAKDPIEPPSEDVLALDEALESLRQRDERKCDVVTLRYFAGLTIEETAKVLNISEPTVERDWRFARALLHAQLAPGENGKAE